MAEALSSPTGTGSAPERGTAAPLPAYVLPAQSPLETQVRNVLHTRNQPWRVMLGSKPCDLSVPVTAMPFQPAYRVHIRCGEAVWLLDVAGNLPLRLHPALAAVNANAELPQALCHAVIDLLVAPHATALGGLLATSVACESVPVEGPLAFAPSCTIPLLLTIPDLPEGLAVPLALHLPDRDAALTLAARLMELPAVRCGRSHVTVPVSVEAARMPLTLSELASLAPDDILLPGAYPAMQGRVLVTVPGSVIHCSLAGRIATVDTIVNTESLREAPVTEEQTSSAAACAAVDVDGLEVTMTFELERRLMTVGDLATVAPGYTFALGVDPLAPVTLRVAGRAVGMGRLVDIGGTVGVQVMSMNESVQCAGVSSTTAHAAPAPATPDAVAPDAAHAPAGGEA